MYTQMLDQRQKIKDKTKKALSTHNLQKSGRRIEIRNSNVLSLRCFVAIM